jgi:hypothetical protein
MVMFFWGPMIGGGAWLAGWFKTWVLVVSLHFSFSYLAPSSFRLAPAREQPSCRRVLHGGWSKPWIV